MRGEAPEACMLTTMPDCDGSNSSRSTAPLSVARMSRSSRSSSSPELRYTSLETSPAPTLLAEGGADPLSRPADAHGSIQSDLQRLPGPAQPVRKLSSVPNKPKYDLQCCTLPVCLVTLQLLLGFTIMVFGVTMLLMTPSVKTRDAPYWAGLVLIMAGGVGLYFSATREQAYSGSIKAFIVKASFFLLSVVCLFVSTIASAFCGIQGENILSLINSEKSNCISDNHYTCHCTKVESDGLSRIYTFLDIIDCQSFLLNLKTYMFIQCILNGLGGIASFLVVILMWRNRYMDFHSGLRFYSYSASIPNHPWSDPQTPPYTNYIMANGDNGQDQFVFDT
ncbi:sarcospan-like [Acanthaster planci]|uniref:Sarcospan-like n=1 Tax=Acanthaster planci TaxID=133434 RepID=A0A8B7ZNH1_ACAPL|nr:sarcospan-like [Acanthaster planci]XP_022104929.1 sarcospan-like [Acanthaster planci]XP_022104930.1 sarcospan-like [Acanthaster planci]XP_022104931.1 sarcospan-like [Acanthaster planci]XP_022104932.1 sarcospan-like [Acanthaster planci]XP_022104933.1 sarcospan-like [Acanthaster planci]XP_022104934.1 sarcospan-like [Acanthaster planci]XP_022104935.1 sarcospan-like [Acanthaster planci]